MLWDESFESWIQLGVSSQPTAILLTPDGTIITGWVGRSPEDQVRGLSIHTLRPTERRSVMAENAKNPRRPEPTGIFSALRTDQRVQTESVASAMAPAVVMS